jgi:hypothetical protein
MGISAPALPLVSPVGEVKEAAILCGVRNGRIEDRPAKCPFPHPGDLWSAVPVAAGTPTVSELGGRAPQPRGAPATSAATSCFWRGARIRPLHVLIRQARRHQSVWSYVAPAPVWVFSMSIIALPA